MNSYQTQTHLRQRSPARDELETGLDLEIALEPDALHRETQRRLQLGSDAARAPLVLERGYWTTSS